MNIKKITIELNDGTELAFEPHFDASITERRGTMRVHINSPFIPDIMPNGRETLVIVCAPDHIREMLMPVIDNVIDKLIDT
jgi:hypothetical protein